ncbi:DNA-binding protein [Sporosarcina sp. P37]|uniref:CvfB family protein n=1 Tax=unclassified Sporosarcina TaxID=2647733 RepID=UPI0009C0B960|nr:MULTISPECIES: S1-like domain-containing RNA-binding protein [unclassified Sporosarcina]ARD48038.1 DNA-binding protein [Sporosarcina sp. P33]ARK24553.1 DNA-binding protein [Sporosarcina sp. P37]PID19710.1 DNA-binding protein [Sporosarcina sp. P35]
MTLLKPGTLAKLEILRKEGSRFVLDAAGEEIYMNESEAPDALEQDMIEVFLYINRRGELTATAQLPTVTVDSFGWAKVIRLEQSEGAYVDIGASFEVLVNRADFPQIKTLWPQPGDQLYMTLRTDPGGNLFGRLVTEERIQEHYTMAEADMYNQNVKARAYRLLPVGSFLLTEDIQRIFVHETERRQEPRLGEEVDVRIIAVHDDGTMNGSLLPRKQERLQTDGEQILAYLQECGGKMPFTDKSSPEEIDEMFQMSKGAFKRALGTLMKERKITQADGWTTLT